MEETVTPKKRGPKPLKAENEALKAQNEALAKRLEKLEQLMAGTAKETPVEAKPTEVPIFDAEMPHGVVWGDTEVAFVQNGHQFGHDRQYLRTETQRGTPRPFNPKLVGFTRKPKLVSLD